MSKIDPNKLLISSDFYSVQGEGISCGVPSYFVRLGICNLTSLGVKPGRRAPRVMTPYGKNIPIHHLRPGDEILAHNENSDTLTTTVVQAVYEYKLDEHYEISIEDTPVLFTSGEHLFLTPNGWKRVDELSVGDEILHYNNTEKLSYMMKNNNPMKSADITKKKVLSTDYSAVGSKISATRRSRFDSGELRGSLLVLKEKDPDRYNDIVKSISTRMKKFNPMFNPDVVKNSNAAHNLNSTKDGVYHSKTERKFHELCISMGLHLEYTGNYDFSVEYTDSEGRIRNLYPDFILPGTNKVYEIYWSGNGGKFTKKSDYRKTRTEYYKAAGYDCVFVDYSILKTDDIRTIIENEIHALNGKKVVNIKKITASKYPSLYKPLTAYDITCEPYNTFIVENLVTHNCGMSRKFVNELLKQKSLEDGEIFVGDLQEQKIASWTCDSTSQWLWRGVDKDFQYLIDQWKEQGIYEDILNGVIHLIWTGGEPTIKGHQVAIVNFHKYWSELEKDNLQTKTDLVDYNNGRQYTFYKPLTVFNEIETNGSLYIEDDLFLILDQINCSPKLANSGMTAKQRIVPDAIKRIMEHPNYQFKFVISTEDDVKEMFRDFIEPFNIPLRNVVCMPGLDNQEDFHERTRFVLEMAKKYKFRGLTRLHLSAWDQVLNV